MGILWWLHFESQGLESAYHYWLVSWLVLLLDFHVEGCCVQHEWVLVALNFSEWWYSCSLCTVWMSHHINKVDTYVLQNYVLPKCYKISNLYSVCITFVSFWIVCVVLDCEIQVLHNNITWYNNITCVYYICVWDIYIGRWSYSSAYVLPPVYIYIIHMVHIYVVFICSVYLYCIYLFPNILYQLCEIYPWLDKTFGGVYAYVSCHMQLMCMVKYVMWCKIPWYIV